MHREEVSGISRRSYCTVCGGYERVICQGWDSNPRLQSRLRPERSALDRSATLTCIVGTRYLPYLTIGYIAHTSDHVLLPTQIIIINPYSCGQIELDTLTTRQIDLIITNHYYDFSD